MEQEIRFRVTTEFKKVLESQANELNLSLSAYIRMKLSK